MTELTELELPTLYHYTCDHGHQGIGSGTGVLLARGLAWLTDLEVPIRDALGLTSVILSCDRTRHRYRATDALEHVRPWMEVRRQVPAAWVEALETTPGAAPRHWWVSSWPVMVEYDPLGAS